MKNKRKIIDMTKGSIVKGLLLFTIPLLISSIIQQMYNTVDLLFVGNLLGTEAAAAVGASSILITCLVGFFSGLSVGTNVILAKFFGGSKKEKLKKAIHTAITIAIIGGVILSVVGIIGAPYFLKLINTPNTIIMDAIIYIRIYFITITSMLLYNMGSGIIRAGGNSYTPMAIQFVGGIINIVTNTILVYFLNFGIKGAAWATFISQTTTAILVLVYLVRQKNEFKLNLCKLTIDKEILKKIAIVGIPAGVQALVITVSNVVVQSYINILDVNSIAAFTTYMKVELLLYYPIVAMGQAIMTFTGQNVGANNIERVKKGVLFSIVFGICLTLISSIVVLKTGEMWFGLFNKNVDVIAIGMEFIAITFPFYFVYVIFEILAATIRGAGKSIAPMIVILVNVCVLRITLLSILFPRLSNVKAVAVTYPITWIATSLGMIVLYRIYIKVV